MSKGFYIAVDASAIVLLIASVVAGFIWTIPVGLYVFVVGIVIALIDRATG